MLILLSREISLRAGQSFIYAHRVGWVGMGTVTRPLQLTALTINRLRLLKFFFPTFVIFPLRPLDIT